MAFSLAASGQMESSMFGHPDMVNLFVAIIAISGSSKYQDVILAAMPTIHSLVLHSTSVSQLVFCRIEFLLTS